MVSTISAVIVISIEGGAKSKISKARFLVSGLAISPPNFLKFCRRAFPPEFSEKKNWQELLVWTP